MKFFHDVTGNYEQVTIVSMWSTWSLCTLVAKNETFKRVWWEFSFFKLGWHDGPRIVSFLPHNRVNEYFSVTTLTDHIRKRLASKVPTSNGQERLKGRVRVLQIIETSIHFFVVPIKWNDLDWQKEKRKLKERISDKTSKESSKLIMPVTRSSIQLF